MLKRFLLLLAVLAFAITLTSEPADAQAHNAVGEYYIPLDYDPAGGLSITGAEYTVPPAPPGTTRVLVEASVEIAGYTWVENSSTSVSWASPHTWANWSAGYLIGPKHVGQSSYIGGTAWSLNWATNTSQLGGSMYNSQPVGWPTVFDGVLDGVGSSGRWWQLRGSYLVPVSTTNVQPWRTVSPLDGKHHFRLDAKATGGFMGSTPPGARAFATGHLKVHWCRVTYS